MITVPEMKISPINSTKNLSSFQVDFISYCLTILKLNGSMIGQRSLGLLHMSWVVGLSSVLFRPNSIRYLFGFCHSGHEQGFLGTQTQYNSTAFPVLNKLFERSFFSYE